MIMMGGSDRVKGAINDILGPEVEVKGEEQSSPNALKECVSEFIDAVHSKDVEGALRAFRSAFAECENMPHEEYGE